MTEKELCSNLGIYFFVFDDELYEDEAFYIPGIRTIFLSDRITEEIASRLFCMSWVIEATCRIYTQFLEKSMRYKQIGT